MSRVLLETVLESQLESLGEQGVEKLKEVLNTLVAETPEGWKKGVYTIVTDAVSNLGPVGVNKALSAIHDLLDGGSPDLNWADLESVSDILAQMQNEEASERDAARTFLIQVGGVLNDIATGLVMSLV